MDKQDLPATQWKMRSQDGSIPAYVLPAYQAADVTDTRTLMRYVDKTSDEDEETRFRELEKVLRNVTDPGSTSGNGVNMPGTDPASVTLNSDVQVPHVVANAACTYVVCAFNMWSVLTNQAAFLIYERNSNDFNVGPVRIVPFGENFSNTNGVAPISAILSGKNVSSDLFRSGNGTAVLYPFSGNTGQFTIAQITSQRRVDEMLLSMASKTEEVCVIHRSVMLGQDIRKMPNGAGSYTGPARGPLNTNRGITTFTVSPTYYLAGASIASEAATITASSGFLFPPAFGPGIEKSDGTFGRPYCSSFPTSFVPDGGPLMVPTNSPAVGTSCWASNSFEVSNLGLKLALPTVNVFGLTSLTGAFGPTSDAEIASLSPYALTYSPTPAGPGATTTYNTRTVTVYDSSLAGNPIPPNTYSIDLRYVIPGMQTSINCVWNGTNFQSDQVGTVKPSLLPWAMSPIDQASISRTCAGGAYEGTYNFTYTIYGDDFSDPSSQFAGVPFTSQTIVGQVSTFSGSIGGGITSGTFTVNPAQNVAFTNPPGPIMGPGGNATFGPVTDLRAATTLSFGSGQPLPITRVVISLTLSMPQSASAPTLWPVCSGYQNDYGVSPFGGLPNEPLAGQNRVVPYFTWNSSSQQLILECSTLSPVEDVRTPMLFHTGINQGQIIQYHVGLSCNYFPDAQRAYLQRVAHIPQHLSPIVQSALRVIAASLPVVQTTESREKYTNRMEKTLLPAAIHGASANPFSRVRNFIKLPPLSAIAKIIRQVGSLSAEGAPLASVMPPGVKQAVDVANIAMNAIERVNAARRSEQGGAAM